MPARSCAGPQLLLVDELSLGLAPVVVEDLAQRLVEIRNELGITILLVEQNAAVALSIADCGYVLENGRVVLDGDAPTLQKSSATSRNSISAARANGAPIAM